MKTRIAGWFRRNNTIMAQAKGLQRQWQEMREEKDEKELTTLLQRIEINVLREENESLLNDKAYLTNQLHRVARERDQERKLRLEIYGVCHAAMNQIAEERSLRLALEEHYDELLDEERKKRLAVEGALLDKYMVDKTWEEMTKELHDTYLEELENEEE